MDRAMETTGRENDGLSRRGGKRPFVRSCRFSSPAVRSFIFRSCILRRPVEGMDASELSRVCHSRTRSYRVLSDGVLSLTVITVTRTTAGASFFCLIFLSESSASSNCATQTSSFIGYQLAWTSVTSVKLSHPYPAMWPRKHHSTNAMKKVNVQIRLFKYSSEWDFAFQQPQIIPITRTNQAYSGLKVGPGRQGRRPGTFDLPGLYRVSCLLSCSSKSHKIPQRMHQSSPFSNQK